MTVMIDMIDRFAFETTLHTLDRLAFETTLHTEVLLAVQYFLSVLGQAYPGAWSAAWGTDHRGPNAWVELSNGQAMAPVSVAVIMNYYRERASMRPSNADLPAAVASRASAR